MLILTYIFLKGRRQLSPLQTANNIQPQKIFVPTNINTLQDKQHVLLQAKLIKSEQHINKTVMYTTTPIAGKFNTKFLL